MRTLLYSAIIGLCFCFSHICSADGANTCQLTFRDDVGNVNYFYMQDSPHGGFIEMGEEPFYLSNATFNTDSDAFEFSFRSSDKSVHVSGFLEEEIPFSIGNKHFVVIGTRSKDAELYIIH